MKTALRTIRILVAILIIKNIRCQDGFSEQDFLRLQQYSMSDGQNEAVNTFNNNAQRVQYHPNNENTGDYNRNERSRGRKVYRIKNPFQQQLEEEKSAEESNIQDSDTGASNQYAAMQYSLPPEDFLQKLRADQYHQQQQLTTPVSTSLYTATPQPQYQYSTNQPSNYPINQQSNQLSTVDPKAYSSVYQTNINSYQYPNQNLYSIDNTHSTPIPPYISTQNTQYVSTPADTYVSSSSPIYLSSSQNLQQYVSSPNTNTQTGVLEYNNNRVTTIANNYDSNNELSKRMQIDHYDNSANGIRYPTHNIQNQFQNNYTPTTPSPTSSVFPDSLRDTWQYSSTGAYKLDNGYSQSQLQNIRYTNNQKDNRHDNHADSSNSKTHFIGTMPSANNMFLNYMQPDYQHYNNIKSQTTDLEPDTSQSDMYSHGEYGWKMSDKKSSYEPEVLTKNNNFFKYQIQNAQPDTGVVSQVSFQMDSGKPYNYDHNIKPVTEKFETDEFVRAATKAHERYKQQLEASKYLSNSHYNSNEFGISANYNTDYKPTNKYSQSYYGNSQSDSVTMSPFYYINSRETVDGRIKQPFDHDKAIKNIVPLDVSNVVQNSESSGKVASDINTNNRYNFLGYKDAIEQNFKHFTKPSDSYYGDKSSFYYTKPKSDEYISLERLKQLEQNNYYGKNQTPESYNLGSGNKRFVDELSQSLNYPKQILNNQQIQDSSQSAANINQQGSQQSQISSEIANILKFNDLPYRLTQSLSANTQQLRNNNFEGNIPTPLPIRINQNLEEHHLDVAAEILNKLIANKQNNNRPDTESQSGNNLPTINGFKVVNPYNVDLKLVAEMLKGKSVVDESYMTPLRDLNNPLPMKLDVSQLQQVLQFKNENPGMGLNNGLSSLGNSLFDIYNSGRFPYQGVKYSRSEEEPENIPIADSSNSHPIGAVVEQEEAISEEGLSDAVESSEDSSTSFDEERPKNTLKSVQREIRERYKHPRSYSSRYSYKRKYPKSEFEEPYPLLKPPPPNSSRHRVPPKADKGFRRRRVTKPKMIRVFKTEPLFEADTSLVDEINPFSLKRSQSVAEEKSDAINEDEST